MPLHVERTSTAIQEIIHQYNVICSTRWVQLPQGRSVLEIQTTHTPQALQKIPENSNYLPPRRYIFTLEGKAMTISASDPQPVRIPATARHTFKVDDTFEGPCTLEISADASPASGQADLNQEGISSKFFRNIYTYLDDCYLQSVKPSLPQLLLMLDSAEISLALPGPGWIARPLSWAMGVVVGRWFGGHVLGYKPSYPEYRDEERECRKRQ